MAISAKFTPASFWRAFFILPLLAAGGFGATPAVQPPELAQIGKPDAAGARRILDQFRRSGIAGEYYFEFDLHELPRRGDATVVHGRLWGGRNEQGAVMRIVMADAAGGEHRLLVQNGERPAVWRTTAGRATELEGAAVFAPVVPGVELSAFDLQMPFLYWPDASVESIKRVRGRPAHEFRFRPPAAFAAQHPELAAVRSYFDTQFNAPMQTELLGRDGRATKTLSLLELKTVDGQTIPKSFEVRNETTRDKTRLVVTRVALNLQLPASLFAPAALSDDVPPPPVGQTTEIAP